MHAIEDCFPWNNVERPWKESEMADGRDVTAHLAGSAGADEPDYEVPRTEKILVQARHRGRRLIELVPFEVALRIANGVLDDRTGACNFIPLS